MAYFTPAPLFFKLFQKDIDAGNIWGIQPLDRSSCTVVWVDISQKGQRRSQEARQPLSEARDGGWDGKGPIKHQTFDIHIYIYMYMYIYIYMI